MRSPDSEQPLDAASPQRTAPSIGELLVRVSNAPENASYWSELGIAQGTAGRFADGVVALQRSLELRPGHVLSLAYLGLLLHAQQRHDEARAILDYEGMVATSRCDPEEELIADFNRRLLAHVKVHPSLNWEPALKSTWGGWQTGELLRDGSEMSVELERFLRRQIHALINDDDAEEDVPMQLTAWSVGLHSGGRQGPHVHQAGIVSGVYYPQVPAMGGTATAGCLRFPRTLPWLPLVSEAEALSAHLIRPQTGLLVVFPSYFWHETVPFSSPDERISLAFDVLPPSLGSS